MQYKKSVKRDMDKIMLDFLIGLSFFVILFLPYIICIILYFIAIYIIKKLSAIKENKKFKVLSCIVVIFLIVGCYASVKYGYAFLSYISAKPDETYAEMAELSDNQSLIGLSKEQVVKLLGKPDHTENDEDVYLYDAGKVTNYLFFGESDFYELRIIFDENDIVKNTSIKGVV